MSLLFLSSALPRGGRKRPLVESSIDKVVATSSLMWMPHAKQPDLELCPVILPCLLPNADSRRSVRQATQGANEGKWYARARPLSKCTRANGSAPMGARGMGSIAGNLPRLSAPLPPSFSHFAFPAEVALVRLDGPYGDAAVIAQLMLAGVYLVTRGRGYQLLEYPHRLCILAHPPTASVTESLTGVIVDLFEGGWLEPCRGLPHARVIVARHPAPPADKKVRVGKRVDEWVYELFITTLDARTG